MAVGGGHADVGGDQLHVGRAAGVLHGQIQTAGAEEAAQLFGLMLHLSRWRKGSLVGAILSGMVDHAAGEEQRARGRLVSLHQLSLFVLALEHDGLQLLVGEGPPLPHAVAQRWRKGGVGCQEGIRLDWTVSC